MAGNPNPIITVGRSLGYVRKPDFDTSIGAEVGGPLIKDKLFFWAGFAPRFNDTHVFRQTYAQLDDPINGGPRAGRERQPDRRSSSRTGARASPRSRKTYYFGATVDFIPRPEHRLTVALLGTPSFNNQMRVVRPAWSSSPTRRGPQER